jgi:hypothetical protein
MGGVEHFLLHPYSTYSTEESGGGQGGGITPLVLHSTSLLLLLLLLYSTPELVALVKTR